MAAIAKATTAYHSNAPESFANAFPAFHVSELISLPLRYSRLKTSRSEKDRKRKTVSAKKKHFDFSYAGCNFSKGGAIFPSGKQRPGPLLITLEVISKLPRPSSQCWADSAQLLMLGRITLLITLEVISRLPQPSSQCWANSSDSESNIL